MGDVLQSSIPFSVPIRILVMQQRLAVTLTKCLRYFLFNIVPKIHPLSYSRKANACANRIAFFSDQLLQDENITNAGSPYLLEGCSSNSMASEIVRRH